MTKKITKIELYNYKAFYSKTAEPFTFSLPDEKNLIIYGENGSGKSSLFEGLRDFFRSASDSFEFNNNIFSEGSLPTPPYVEVSFSNEPITYRFSKEEYQTNTKSSPFINDVNKIKAFICYKDLLRTHFIQTEAININLFPLLFGKTGILSNITTPLLGNTLDSERTYSAFWDYLEGIRTSIINKRPSKNVTTQSEIYNVGSAIFKDAVDKFLGDIRGEINSFLKYFDRRLIVESMEIEIEFIDEATGIKNKEIVEPKILLHLKFYDNSISKYHQFLNEARLTALAISIYLAAVDSNPSSDYHILFLDDILIGLDTSNRIPLLNIIKEKLINKYQIIMTTYDRYWFEIAKEQLGAEKWHSAEMFVHEDDDLFYPVIIQPSLDYYDTAQKYFQAHDYPACGNYQRKACESYIKKFIPKAKQLQAHGNGTILEINDLEPLFNNLLKYMRENGLDTTPLREFNIFKRLVLNKLSHDDIKSPYYRAEIEIMFSILDALKLLKREVIVNTNELVYFEYLKPNGDQTTIATKVKDDLILLTQGKNKIFQKCVFQTDYIEDSTSKLEFKSKDGDLMEVYEFICSEQSIAPVTNVYSQFKDKNGNVLESFLNSTK